MDNPEAGQTKKATPEKLKVVERGVMIFFHAEDDLEQAGALVAKLAGVMDDARDAGMLGKLQASHMKARIHSIAGGVATELAKLHALHTECTAVAKEHGVDQVPDGKGGVIPLGGGPR